MFETIRGRQPAPNADEAGRHAADPLARIIVMDLLVITAGFLLMVVAVVLTVEGLSLH
jgi:multisubunit Na+/H+ antiporter MnhC subunit